MSNKLFKEQPKTTEISAGRWLQLLPAGDAVYRVYDLQRATVIGRILFDDQGHWIYDGGYLTIQEQESLAGSISGYQREMIELLASLKER